VEKTVLNVKNMPGLAGYVRRWYLVNNWAEHKATVMICILTILLGQS